MSLHILITEFLTLKYIKLVYVFTCAFSASNTPCVLFYFYFFLFCSQAYIIFLPPF